MTYNKTPPVKTLSNAPTYGFFLSFYISMTYNQKKRTFKFTHPCQNPVKTLSNPVNDL